MIAYQKKLNSTMSVPKTLELDREMENKRKILVRSFSLARNMYAKGAPGKNPSKGSELEVGAEFLEVKNTKSTLHKSLISKRQNGLETLVWLLAALKGYIVKASL